MAQLTEAMGNKNLQTEHNNITKLICFGNLQTGL